MVQALTAMPQVSPSAWRASPVLVRWLISARASVLVMTFTASILGGLLTISESGWSLTAWLVCTVGLLLAHAANNQLNDLTDSVRGIDEGNYFRLRYGAHVLEDGLLSRRGLILYMSVTAALAAACGIWLVLTVDVGLLLPFLFGSLLLLFYTWPLKQWGLGELAVLLVWGPLMVAGTGHAATGSWDWQLAAVGLCFALGPTTVIFGKHIDKLVFDEEKGVRTLPVRLGDHRARAWVRRHVLCPVRHRDHAGRRRLVTVAGAAVPRGAAAMPAQLARFPGAGTQRAAGRFSGFCLAALVFGLCLRSHPLVRRAVCCRFLSGSAVWLSVKVCVDPFCRYLCTPGMFVPLVVGLASGANAAGWQPPNIVVVLVDDAGFMDFGGYGGEANTPSIDRIADQGVRFSNYHTSPLCAPVQGHAPHGPGQPPDRGGDHPRNADGAPGG